MDNTIHDRFFEFLARHSVEPMEFKKPKSVDYEKFANPSKRPGRPNIFYSGGYKIITDYKMLVADSSRYIQEYEGKAIFNGAPVDWRVPKWREIAFPDSKSVNPIYIGYISALDYISGIVDTLKILGAKKGDIEQKLLVFYLNERCVCIELISIYNFFLYLFDNNINDILCRDEQIASYFIAKSYKSVSAIILNPFNLNEYEVDTFNILDSYFIPCKVNIGPSINFKKK